MSHDQKFKPYVFTDEELRRIASGIQGGIDALDRELSATILIELRQLSRKVDRLAHAKPARRRKRVRI